ncbi:MAG: redoxin family protein [bacterium]|nr:redoxin family protein [bacterium]
MFKVADWKGKPAPEFVDGEWLDGSPLTLMGLRGRVVIVDFWEYSCINCIRTLPYLRGWYKRYHDRGLEIIGVHVPEFEFGKERANVEAAIKQHGITWPVVLDNDYRTWNAYNNNVWPRELLINQAGIVVHDQSGEGGYRETEQQIQELLKQAGDTKPMPKVLEYVRETDHPGRACYRTSPELYLGAERGILGNAEKPTTKAVTFAEPTKMQEDVVYVAGTWSRQGQFIQRSEGSAKKSAWLGLMYHAKGVYLVIKPQTESGFTVWVEQDDVPLTAQQAGQDVIVDERGSYLKVDQARMYRLVNNPEFGVHTLKLYPESDSFGAYAFTFESACQ